jgi:hypothetical protein
MFLWIVVWDQPADVSSWCWHYFSGLKMSFKFLGYTLSCINFFYFVCEGLTQSHFNDIWEGALWRLWQTKLQRHCTANSKQIFPEMKLRGLVPHSNIHVSVTIYAFPRSVYLFCCSNKGGPIVGIYKSFTDTFGNWERGRAVSVLGIRKSDLICSVINWPIGYTEHTLSDF